jgi:hypothetical protein
VLCHAFNICKERTAKLIETSHKGRLTRLWNQQVKTNRTIRNNKPGIIICNSAKGTCALTDAAISGARNVIKTEAEKMAKYKDITTEIQRMWSVKTNVTPLITGATGTISKSSREYLSSVPAKRDIKELQKTAVLGTANVLRKVLI